MALLVQTSRCYFMRKVGLRSLREFALVEPGAPSRIVDKLVCNPVEPNIPSSGEMLNCNLIGSVGQQNHRKSLLLICLSFYPTKV